MTPSSLQYKATSLTTLRRLIGRFNFSDALSAKRAMLLVSLGGGLALLPALLLGVPSNPDLSNHYHFALPFYDALLSGDFQPGWFASANHGFGDPVFRFYPPALYYLMAGARAFFGSWYVGTLLVFTLISIIGSLGAYFWARSFLSRGAAVWAGVVYAFMPYHVAEYYQAAQLAEYAAGPALLFAFGCLKRISDTGKTRYVAGLAIAYACLILTHLPLAVMGSFSLLIYGILCLKRDRLMLTITKMGVAVLIGLAASAFYWITVVSEMRWILADGANPDSLLDYRQNFIFSSFSPDTNLTIWWMNILMIATIGMFLPALALLRKSSEGSLQKSVRAAFVLLAISLLMATEASKWIWAIVPPLQKTQHPFRWLGVVSAVVPILLAASLSHWRSRFNGSGRPLALVAGGVIAISLTFTVAQTMRDANYLSRSSFEQMLGPLRESPSINQWLPIWANSYAQGKASYDKTTTPDSGSLAEASGRSVAVNSWQAERREFSVAEGPATELRVRTFFYPHWKATSAGETLATSPASDGVLLISLPQNARSVELTFQEPSRVRLGAFISIFAWLLIGALFVVENKRSRD
ncbi:MAG: hypothetical protein QOE77_3939 [Blastocatellia bacterium]|nr:hypothetical protein [Blastocatellia bacterium]